MLKTYEKGAIVAHFNTDSFLGQRGATLTVTIDQPFYAEVQLHVRGYIRSDVVVEPGSVQFGSIDQGTAAEQTVAVNYAGRERLANPRREELQPAHHRQGGRDGPQLRPSVLRS